MKCYECGRKLYRRYRYCPYCGKCLAMCSREIYAFTTADFAQANRIERKIDKLLKRLKVKEDKLDRAIKKAKEHLKDE